MIASTPRLLSIANAVAYGISVLLTFGLLPFASNAELSNFSIWGLIFAQAIFVASTLISTRPYVEDKFGFEGFEDHVTPLPLRKARKSKATPQPRKGAATSTGTGNSEQLSAANQGGGAVDEVLYDSKAKLWKDDGIDNQFREGVRSTLRVTRNAKTSTGSMAVLDSHQNVLLQVTIAKGMDVHKELIAFAEWGCVVGWSEYVHFPPRDSRIAHFGVQVRKEFVDTLRETLENLAAA